ncbi:hypothetical protein KFL_009400040 [Klebsormidium nitens]|uniref:Uncharacterized protein n=1 Tax=Klebsormidium nitens TaxID=105231 RepID=A0A1Y1IQ65_KLENI|nr:hypothetical protein KFL_009400040 [Klebsormidium nitens]|eukprot:GAQ92182.1 hypothetical protein KFL_009400040 [Klebsormidium nitens]
MGLRVERLGYSVFSITLSRIEHPPNPRIVPAPVLFRGVPVSHRVPFRSRTSFNFERHRLTSGQTSRALTSAWQLRAGAGNRAGTAFRRRPADLCWAQGRLGDVSCANGQGDDCSALAALPRGTGHRLKSALGARCLEPCERAGSDLGVNWYGGAPDGAERAHLELLSQPGGHVTARAGRGGWMTSAWWHQECAAGLSNYCYRL